jgi:Aldo/keto reductase family
VVEVAEERGASPAQVALAWLLERPAVTSVSVGARTSEQLGGNLGAADLSLTADRLGPTWRGDRRSGSRPVGGQEGDDLADGRPVGHHAGVALARVQAQAAVGDALGGLAEQLRGVEGVATSRVGAVMRWSRGEASNTSSAATVTSMSEGSSTRWLPPNSHIRTAKARPPAAVAASPGPRAA